MSDDLKLPPKETRQILSGHAIEPDHAARMYDAWQYAVTLRNGVTRCMADPRPLDTLYLDLAKSQQNGGHFFWFQGGHDAEEAIDETGKPKLHSDGSQVWDLDDLQGAGAICIADIAAVQYWDDEEHTAASEAAQQSAAALLAFLTGAAREVQDNAADTADELEDPNDLPATIPAAPAADPEAAQAPVQALD